MDVHLTSTVKGQPLRTALVSACLSSQKHLALMTITRKHGWLNDTTCKSARVTREFNKRPKHPSSYYQVRRNQMDAMTASLPSIWPPRYLGNGTLRESGPLLSLARAHLILRADVMRPEPRTLGKTTTQIMITGECQGWQAPKALCESIHPHRHSGTLKNKHQWPGPCSRVRGPA